MPRIAPFRPLSLPRGWARPVRSAVVKVIPGPSVRGNDPAAIKFALLDSHLRVSDPDKMPHLISTVQYTHFGLDHTFTFRAEGVFLRLVLHAFQSPLNLLAT